MLGLDVGLQGFGRRAVVGKATALGLDGPFLGIAVAVEDDALVCVEDIAADGDCLGLDVLGAFETIGVFLEALGNGSVEYRVEDERLSSLPGMRNSNGCR